MIATSELSFDLSDIAVATPLSAEDERTLAGRLAEGDQDARDRLIQSCLRLVVVVAHRHKNRGLDLDDLVSEGNLGLIRAVETFDPAYGRRLSTVWPRGSLDGDLMVLTPPPTYH